MNYAIKYIKNPSEKVQLEAIKENYDAIRYIKNPSYKIELEAIKENESAINFIQDLDEEKMVSFLKQNILVIKYLYKKLSIEKIEEALKEVISKEDVEEKYIRDFLNCSVIDRNSDAIKLDKVIFIYKYGSKMAKKIAMDE